MSRIAVVALVAVVAACGGSGIERRSTPAIADGVLLRLQPVARGFTRPVHALVAPGKRDRLYVVEQRGIVWAVDGGRRTRFLDVRNRVSTGGERGLLSTAFHPHDARMYLSYTDRAGDSRVDEYRVGGGRAVFVRELLRVEQPYENHNGGHIAFGADGLLYLGLGDGGGAFDPEGRAQDPGTRLGKLLRRDVETPGKWDIVAAGLRNPWRFAFDPPTGDLWVADVGQDLWEEVNVVRGGVRAPLNFGWDRFEGHERVEDGALAPGRVVRPVAVYGHDLGCSITGGFVYRGRRVEALRGRYVFADFCSGAVFSIRASDGRDIRRERVSVTSPVSIGTDADGELLVVSAEGMISRLVGGR